MRTMQSHDTGRSVANAYGKSWEKNIKGCKSWRRIVIIIV